MTNGKDCATNVLSFALALNTADKLLDSEALDYSGDTGFYNMLIDIAENLDHASSGIAAAVTVCDLGARAKEISVEVLTLAHKAAEFPKIFTPDKFKPDFSNVHRPERERVDNELIQIAGNVHRILQDLAKNDFESTASAELPNPDPCVPEGPFGLCSKRHGR